MKITKPVGYAISWLTHSGKTPIEIADELKLTEKQVTSFLEKHYKNNDNKLATKSEPVKKKSSKDLMIRHTRDKKINSVSIMTREASEVNDSMRPSLNKSVKNQDCIFNPNN